MKQLQVRRVGVVGWEARSSGFAGSHGGEGGGGWCFGPDLESGCPSKFTCVRSANPPNRQGRVIQKILDTYFAHIRTGTGDGGRQQSQVPIVAQP